MTSHPLRTAAPQARGVADAAALARAEAALQALSGEFAGWMTEEVARLEAAHARYVAEGGAPGARHALRTRAHDLKGLGTTCGHPLVTRLCASLHRVLDAPDRAPDEGGLADAHVAAVRAATDGSAPEADKLAACGRLEARVAEALGPA